MKNRCEGGYGWEKMIAELKEKVHEDLGLGR